jgi:hypothetical protein
MLREMTKATLLHSHIKSEDAHMADKERGGCKCWRSSLTIEIRRKSSNLFESNFYPFNAELKLIYNATEGGRMD